MSTRESLPCTKCDSYLNQSLTNVPSILSHFSSSNASVFDRIDRKSGQQDAETDLVCRLLLEKKNKQHCAGGDIGDSRSDLAQSIRKNLRSGQQNTNSTTQ